MDMQEEERSLAGGPKSLFLSMCCSIPAGPFFHQQINRILTPSEQ